MTALPFKYIRLARPTAGVGTYSSLWLGPDHLLQVRSTGWSESYQQFMFGDIRGIFVGGSKRRANWNIVWGVFVGISAICMIADWDGSVPYVSGSLITIGSTVIAINSWLLGPSCTVYLVTQVQTVKLDALGRLRRARKVLDRVGPLIMSSQAGTAGEPAAATPSVP